MKIEALTTYMKGRPDIQKVYLLNQNYTHGQQVSKAAREYLAASGPTSRSSATTSCPSPRPGISRRTWPRSRPRAPTPSSRPTGAATSSLLFKAAKDFGLNINYSTMNANNPGIPMQLGN